VLELRSIIRPAKRLLEEFAKVFNVKIFRIKAFLHVLLKRLFRKGFFTSKKVFNMKAFYMLFQKAFGKRI